MPSDTNDTSDSNSQSVLQNYGGANVCSKAKTRELTRKERRMIKLLAVGLCANYDKDYGCLPLESCCYMLGKWYTGAYCKYFRNAVLPLNPDLEMALLGRSRGNMKPCAVCGAFFIPKGRKAYCSDGCRIIGTRSMERHKKRNQRRMSRFSD
jgi:predicted nucleic acid-binding Zn ribbon protein